MKKVLIITYYWPPSGGAAVQRWLKFSKYLNEFGWEPIIYTVENGEYPQYDASLENEVPDGIFVLRKPALEPYSIYKKFTGRKKESTLQPEIVSSSKKKSFLENIAIWVRGNFFIPDARKFWINPSIRFLKKYIEQNPVDVIVSTSPPQSTHLIALGLKKHFNLPWLADFRDPWTRVDYFDQLKLSNSAYKKHKKLEQEVLLNADKVLTVSYAWADDFKELGAKDVDIITNGYDTPDLPTSEVEKDNSFSIAHIGNLSKNRTHKVLFDALKELKNELPGFAEALEIKLAGSVDDAFYGLARESGISENIKDLGLINHQQALTETCSAQVLLLLLGDEKQSQGRIPLKVFEYMASQRPIIGIGSTESDVAKILEQSGTGIMLSLNDKMGLKTQVSEYFKNYREGNLKLQNPKKISAYSRKELTSKLSVLLNELVG